MRVTCCVNHEKEIKRFTQHVTRITDSNGIDSPYQECGG